MNIDSKTLDQAIESASEAANRARDYKSETYLAALLVVLLRGRYDNEPVRTTASEPVSTRSTSESAKPYAVSELFSSRNWSTEIDKVVLAGYFLERYGGTPNYTIDEIRSCLVSAKIALPKNLSLAILQSVQRGWLMEVPRGDDNKKAWMLTQTGERRVEQLSKAVE